MGEANNYNFESTLGGSERLPHSANSFKFSTARSVEIAAMTECILRPSHTKLIFQTLPVHMRRRVMSHNCKRLPRKLRQGHMEQLKKSGLPPKQKRPSRKYRRRPTNLLQEYQRRQCNKKWLETHIWHAKRFHMIERWGFRLPQAPCDKAFRACYRATSAHCLLQDLSYLQCLQISGNISRIDVGFKSMTNPSCGLGFCAKAFISGSREGSIHIYKPSCYPYSYIGEVTFLWRPNSGTEKGTVWIFIHPSFYRELYDVILDTFKIKKDEDYEVPQKRSKHYLKGSMDVVVSEIKLNRFSLTGPKSHAVLVRSLKFMDDGNIVKSAEWARKYGDTDKLKLKEKWSYWDCLRNVSSPAELPAHLVLGAVVRDPRLSRPAKRSKAQVDTYRPLTPEVLVNVPQCASSSPLWELTLHNVISAKKWSDGQLIQYATENQLIPGEVHETNPDIQSVPVILIQRPGSQCPKIKKLGYRCGWDIIVPDGYSLPFWRTFIMYGGRAGGLRETESVARESGRCYFPPDSQTGQVEQQRICNEMRETYFRLPPNKRVNYIKLGINSPFLCRWEILLRDWCQSFDGCVYVARNKAKLKEYQNAVERRNVSPALEACKSCLVPVFIKVMGKGNLSPHAVICMPEVNDAKTLYEPCHVDACEKQRKQLRKENRAKLKKMRRLRIKLKKNTAVVVRPKSKALKPKPSQYSLAMRELWLPTSIESVRKSCSREVMGYVSQGGFSFTEACSSGVGYVACGALRQLLLSGVNTVLVRNTRSRRYRTASISIIYC